MSVQSAACVNFLGLGKLSALSIRCFVVKLLVVTILRSFQCNMVGEVRVYWDSRGNMGVILGNMGYQRGNRAVML